MNTPMGVTYMTKQLKYYRERGYFDQNFSQKPYLGCCIMNFAVAVSCSELKPTETFTVIHEKFSP